MRIGALFLTFLLFFACETSCQDYEILKLQDAIRIAIAHNRSIQTATLETDKSSDRVSAVKTRIYPATSLNALTSRLISPFSLSFEEGIFGNFPDIGPVPGQDTKVKAEPAWTTFVVGTVQQPLTQIYKIKLNQALLEASNRETKEKERAEKQDIIHQVKKLYYAILQSQSSIRFSEQEIDLYRELKRVTDDYVLQKVALKSDGLEVNARLAKAEYDAVVARNELEKRKEQFNILLGRDLRTKFSVNSIAGPASFEDELETAQSIALQERPELQQARWRLKEAELDSRIKKSEYLPDVGLSFNYFSPMNIEFVPDHFMSVGFFMSWDVFDWGRKGYELAEKRKTIEQARLSLAETEQRILSDVNSQHRKLKESRMLVEVIRLTQDAAEETLRITTNRFKQQSALLKDVLQAQTSFEETRNQLEQALLSVWVARADFEKAVGMEQ